MINREAGATESRISDGSVVAGAVVAHRLPGRIRLRFRPDAVCQAWTLGPALAAHDDVVAVSWLPSNRSLTVQHRPEGEFELLLRSLPDRPLRPLPPNSNWEVLVGVVFAFTAGFLGLPQSLR